MSIYATWLSLDDDHEDDCAHWDKTNPESWEISGKPCSCGTPRTPLRYQGSHVLPADTDERVGVVDIAAIPGFIERDGRDNGPEGTVHPWLRLYVNDEAVVLTRAHVIEIHDTLEEWLATDYIGMGK